MSLRVSFLGGMTVTCSKCNEVVLKAELPMEASMVTAVLEAAPRGHSCTAADEGRAKANNTHRVCANCSTRAPEGATHCYYCHAKLGADRVCVVCLKVPKCACVSR